MRFPDGVPTLVLGDVTLRAPRLDDVEAIVEPCTDPPSIRWTTVPLDYDAATAADWVTTAIPQEWESGTERLFAIESTHPDGRRRFSGSLALRDRGDRLAEIAFGAHPAIRGHGVTSTAVDLLLDHGFDDLGLETVIWWANRGNVASHRVAWKAGFTFGGTVPRWLDHRGTFLDAWVASLHRDDDRTPKGRWWRTPIIDGGRLRLRPLAAHDVDRTVEACADPRTQHWLPFLPRPYTASDAVEYQLMTLDRSVAGEGVFWAVADRRTDQLLGTVGVPRTLHDSAEIGYWAHPDARGAGVMSEAVRLVLAHVFASEADGGLGMRRAYLKAAAGNTASQQVARAVRFTESGRGRLETVLGDGTYDDVIIFDLLAAEWRELSASVG